MTRNLKAQFTLLFPSVAMVTVVLLAFIPYSILTNTSGNDPSYVYQMEVLLMVPLMSFVYMITTGCILMPMALGYGATRRGWYLALVVSKALTAVFFAAFAVFVCLPLSALVFGNPVTLELSMLPLLVLASFACSTVGEFLGYLGVNKGAKFMIIVMVASVVLFLLGFVAVLIIFWNDGVIFGLSFTNGKLLAAAAGIVAVFQPINWLLVRRLAAR